jgi:hypothetical protein
MPVIVADGERIRPATFRRRGLRLIRARIAPGSISRRQRCLTETGLGEGPRVSGVLLAVSLQSHPESVSLPLESGHVGVAQSRATLPPPALDGEPTDGEEQERAEDAKAPTGRGQRQDCTGANSVGDQP